MERPLVWMPIHSGSLARRVPTSAAGDEMWAKERRRVQNLSQIVRTRGVKSNIEAVCNLGGICDQNYWDY